MPYKKLEEYEPRQRGMVIQAHMKKGNNRLKDGDHTIEECPLCGFLLRVRKEHREGAILWCPCGYEVPAIAIGVKEI